MESNYLWQNNPSIPHSLLPRGPDVSLETSSCPSALLEAGFEPRCKDTARFAAPTQLQRGGCDSSRMRFIEDALHHVLSSTPRITRSP